MAGRKYHRKSFFVKIALIAVLFSLFSFSACLKKTVTPEFEFNFGNPAKAVVSKSLKYEYLVGVGIAEKSFVTLPENNVQKAARPRTIQREVIEKIKGF